MATHATTVTVGTTAATYTLPKPAGPAQRHQRYNLTNMSANDVWARVDDVASGTAVIAADECVYIPPAGFIEIESRDTVSLIASGAGSLVNIWGRP